MLVFCWVAGPDWPVSRRALRDRAAKSVAATRAYAERLGELDLEARAYEIHNLPTLPSEAARAQMLRRVRDCGRLLRDADLATAQSRGALLRAARLPEEAPAAMPLVQVYRLSRQSHGAR